MLLFICIFGGTLFPPYNFLIYFESGCEWGERKSNDKERSVALPPTFLFYNLLAHVSSPIFFPLNTLLLYTRSFYFSLSAIIVAAIG
ncbi:hypothetical protein HanPSC8_Chr13g0558951 [Helianthus annuus]|nr:hypothetical protein HanPSC8_Chr13g0558951 [Helianthus annuus]